MRLTDRRLSLALIPAVIALAGCGTTGVSYDRQTTIPLDAQELRRHPACSLRVCVKEPRVTGFKGGVQNAHLNNLRPFFASVNLTETPGPDLCDVVLRHDSPMLDYANLTSAYDGQFLARFTVPHWSLGGAVCKLFGEGTPGYAKITGGGAPARPSPPADLAEEASPPPRLISMRGTVAGPAPAEAPRRGGFGAFSGARTQEPAPAPAPSQGLSAEDIRRIAQAVHGAEAPKPVEAAPLLSPRFSSPERPDDLAVIVGIESYSEIGTKAPYAERDAEAFKAYVRALGVPERNIVLLTGAKAVRSALTKNIESWLPRLVKPESRVFFFFSGHGAPDVKSGHAYIVPWDGDPNFLEETAYPVAKLYQRLGELPVKQVLVAMDSCFSGAGGRSVLASGARPLVVTVETEAVPSKLTVLAASAANEISGSLDEKGHGAFTYFLLEGLNAGKTTPKALADYLTPRVQDEAKRLNRDQTPQLIGAGDWALR